MVELLVVIAIIALLIGTLLPALSKARRSSRMLVCASNLHQIGLAMQSYANRHKTVLPYAMWVTNFDQKALTWDDLINRDFGGNLTWDEMAAFQCPRVVPQIICPEDERDGRYPYQYRSYAMPRVLNNAYPYAGLEFNGVGGDVTFFTAPVPPTSSVRRISSKLTEFHRPAETLLIVEAPGVGNISGSNLDAFVDAPSAQWAYTPYKPGTKTPHGTRWNYLFIDGHVAAMTAQETVTPVNGVINLNTANGMWTRDPLD